MVEGRDAVGNISRAHLLDYTASVLTTTNISGVVVTTTDSREVTVTWNSNDQAQGYVIRATDKGNEFGEEISTDDIIAVICISGSLLCKEGDEFTKSPPRIVGEKGKPLSSLIR